MYSPVTAGEEFILSGRFRTPSGPLGSIASCVLVFAPAPAEGNTRFQATGTVTITDQVNDGYTFTPSPSDLTDLVPGDWLIQAVATMATGGLRYSLPAPLRVNAPL